MLIYSENISNRLKYVCHVFFKHFCGVEYQMTSDEDVYVSYIGAKVNYSNNADLSGIQIIPADLLYEKGIKEQKIYVDEWLGVPIFYCTNSELAIPFDIFSATFYLITRYEEYLPFIGDQHGRFMAEYSFSFQHNFLNLPVVDHWTCKFEELVLSLYPAYKFGEKKFEFVATVDVDSAFAYQHKGVVRLLGGFAKDVFSLDFKNFKCRWLTVFGGRNDPFNTYDLFDKWHSKYGVESVFFFLVADYGLNDKNVPHTSRIFRELIRSVADYNQVGIHPGYQSANDPFLLGKEIKRLAEIVKRPITRSRQHFLMLRFPDTYARLIDNEIYHDYTMGYADYPGFRAGTSKSYPFYNLQNETLTKLMIHPFAVMDATLNKYRKETPKEAILTIKALMDEVKSVNGTFISLWHNESVSEKWHWKGWREVYVNMLDLVNT